MPRICKDVCACGSMSPELTFTVHLRSCWQPMPPSAIFYSSYPPFPRPHGSLSFHLFIYYSPPPCFISSCFSCPNMIRVWHNQIRCLPSINLHISAVEGGQPTAPGNYAWQLFPLTLNALANFRSRKFVRIVRLSNLKHFSCRILRLKLLPLCSTKVAKISLEIIQFNPFAMARLAFIGFHCTAVHRDKLNWIPS